MHWQIAGAWKTNRMCVKDFRCPDFDHIKPKHSLSLMSLSCLIIARRSWETLKLSPRQLRFPSKFAQLSKA